MARHIEITEFELEAYRTLDDNTLTLWAFAGPGWEKDSLNDRAVKAAAIVLAERR